MNQYISIDDKKLGAELPLRSLFYGEGVFETFRYIKKPPILLDKHFDRMERGANLLKIKFPKREYLSELIHNAVKESKISDAYVKICLLSGGNTVFYEASDSSQVLLIIKQYVFPKRSFSLKVSNYPKNSGSSVIKIKSTSYLENVLARREAVDSGFDEALFLNEGDEITECSSSNIFWFRKGAIFTPSESCGLLRGTTRALLLQLLSDNNMSILEGKFSLNDIRDSDFIFMTNSLIGAVPVSELEGVSYDTENPVFLKLRGLITKSLCWA